MASAIHALLGGVMIGGAAALLYLVHGRIAGISGIWAGTLGSAAKHRDWRIAFVLGLLLAGVIARLVAPATLPVDGHPVPLPVLVVGGLAVGFGTRMGNGCTSGHGVCGLGRGSRRSLSATLTFMGVAVLVVLLTRHVFTGAA